MSAPTYDNIRRLTQELRKIDAKVTTRRRVGIELWSKLKDENVLKKLFVEATPQKTNWPDEDSVAARRSRALQGMWSSAIQGAMFVAQSNAAAKSVKVQPADVLLPLQIFRACVSSEKILRDPSVNIPLLPKKMVRSLLNYTLDFMADEDAMDAVNPSETSQTVRQQLLQILGMMCSNPEHVSFLKYHVDFANILDELYQYIKVDEELANPGCFNDAATALENLFATTKALGIQMYSFSNQTISLISEYLKRCNPEPQNTALSKFYNTVATIIYAHPSHCIGPMKRSGRSILKQAKKLYPNAKTVVKDSLNNYLLAHIFLSQHAGTIQGLVAGQMGELGRATLTLRHLEELLDLVMADRETATRVRLHSKGQMDWASFLGHRQRQHVELATRLMAAAQCEYVIKGQLDTIEHPVDALMSTIPVAKADDDDGDDFMVEDPFCQGSCPSASFIKSPWLKHVLLPFANSVDWRALLAKQTESDRRVPDCAMPLSPDTIRGDAKTNEFSFLEKIQNTAPAPFGETVPLLCLLLTGAAAELFPAGQCWTSDVFNNARKLVPSDPILDSILICRCASIGDFSLIVFLLAALAEEHGGPSGNDEMRMHILITLIKLAEATSLCYRQNKIMKSGHMVSLSGCWQLVWKTILRADLKYMEATKAVIPGSLGELVLTLLVSVARHQCTDSSFWKGGGKRPAQKSFLHCNQDQIWNLHLFRDASAIVSTMPLELICWVCQNAGLSESGVDQIDPSAQFRLVDSPNIDDQPKRDVSKSRRERLLNFCLVVLQKHIEGTSAIDGNDLVMVTTICIATLIQGRILGAHSLEGCHCIRNSIKLTLQTPNKDGSKDHSHADWRDACAEALWASDSFLNTCHTEHWKDVSIAMTSSYRSSAGNSSPCPTSNDFVSGFVKSRLWSKASRCTKQYFMPNESRLNNGQTVASHNIFTKRALALKMCFTLHLVAPEVDYAASLPAMLSLLSDCFNEFWDSRPPDDFREFFLSATQICKAAVEVASNCEYQTKLPLPSLSFTAKSCKLALRGYLERLSNGTDARILDSKGLKESGSKHSDDFLFDDDDEEETAFNEIQEPVPNAQVAQAQSAMTESSSDEDTQRDNRRKRKSSFQMAPPGKTKTSRQDHKPFAIPDPVHAEAVASLLLAIEPSLSNCELVSRALLGADYELDPSDLKGDVDLRSIKNCLNLLVSPSVLLRPSTLAVEAKDDECVSGSTNDSVVSLLYKVLDLVHVNAHPSCKPDISGYSQAASVHTAMKGHSGIKIADEDANRLVDLLCFDLDLMIHPRLREARIRAALITFQDCNEKFHQIWDKKFLSIVKEALVDPDESVRRLSLSGLHAAMTFLDEKRAQDSFSKFIFPVSGMPNDDDRKKLFLAWYKRAGCRQSKEETSIEIEADDMIDLVESHSVCCRAAMASSLSAGDSYFDVLFEIATLSLERPGLQFQCLRALGQIAVSRKYESTEAMIAGEAPVLMHRWVHSNHSVLPLALTAPGTMRLLADSASLKDWCGDDTLYEQLVDEAMFSFLRGRLPYMVPFCIFQIVSSISVLPGGVKQFGGGEGMDLLVSNGHVVLLASMIFQDKNIDESVHDEIKQLIKRHAADVRAFCYPMMLSSDESQATLAESAMNLLANIIPVQELDVRTKKKCHLIARRVLNLAAWSKYLPSILPSSSLPYSDAVRALAHDIGTSAPDDPLLAVGVSAIGNLIGSYSSMDTLLVPAKLLAKWEVLRVQIQLIMTMKDNEKSKQSSVAFCIHLLTEMLLKKKFCLLRSLILSTLQELIFMLDSSRENPDFRIVIRRLIGACFYVHESCQKDILNHQRQEMCSRVRSMRHSLGLGIHSNVEVLYDAWGWNESLSVSLSSMTEHTGESQRSIAGTFDIINWLMENGERLGLTSLDYAAIAPPYAIPIDDLELLRSGDEKFCVQLVLLRHYDDPNSFLNRGMIPVASLISNLAMMLGNRQLWITRNLANSSSENPDVYGDMSPDQRFIQSTLSQIEQGLAVAEDQGNLPSLDTLLNSLHLICNSPCANSLKIDASRCLAALKPESSLRPPIDDAPGSFFSDRGVDIFFSLKKDCLKALHSCLMSGVTRASQAASISLEAILSTESGRHALMAVESCNIQDRLRTFLSPFKHRDNKTVLTQGYFKTVTSKLGIAVNIENQSWCWDDEVWLSFELESVSFEQWICLLCPAIISCCAPTIEDGAIHHRDDDGEFFWLCQKICSVEPMIASNIFPRLILYLVEISERDMSGNFETFLTKSIHRILYHTSATAAYKETEAERRALVLMIDTLNLLRRVSQASFLSKKHSRNMMNIVGRHGTPNSGPDHEKFNAGIPIAPPWQGTPFGILLEIDGLLVAEACIRVKRYASSLFFLDLFLNARFGKAGACFEDFSRSSFDKESCELACSNISGRPRTHQRVTEETNRVGDHMLKAMSLAAHCYKCMGEFDCLEAVHTQKSIIDFNSFGWDTELSAQGHRDPAGVLRALNVHPDFKFEQGGVHITESMEALEFHSLIRLYIDGVLTENSSWNIPMKGAEMQRMVEKWHETRLRRSQWDLLGIQQKQFELPRAPSIDEPQSHGNGLHLGDRFGHTGYFWSVSAAFDAFEQGDAVTCDHYLNEGRTSVLDDLSVAGGFESSLILSSDAVVKLRLLGSLERIWGVDSPQGYVHTSKHFGSLIELMGERLQESRTYPVGEESARVDSWVSLMWLRELGLSALYAKLVSSRDSRRQEVFESLVADMCDAIVVARDHGRPYIAAEAIQRLHFLLSERARVTGNDRDCPCDQIFLLRLEESKVLESQGDFKGAIRKSQQIVNQLLQREQKRENLDLQLQHVLVDAQLFCGSWLTKYKVQQASGVLDGYLQPAAERAKRLHETWRSHEEAERTAMASIALAQTVANLHKALVNRIHSSEWKKSFNIEHHRNELVRCEPLLEDATKSKNKTKKTSKQYETVLKRWEELYIYCEHLRKDLRRTEDEYRSIVESERRYLRLAIESYIDSLSLAGVSTGKDLSRAVSELMSLWFSNAHDAETHTPMKMGIIQIPSFRFVPFTNQLFSRIENNAEVGNEFQSILQSLVYKMCSDHPYHCIVPLLALANGTRVGSGVSGRSASTFIENVGDSKVAPAQNIGNRLQKEASPYVAGLLQSYMALSDAYIDLAGADTSAFHKKKTKDISFSSVLSTSSKTLDRCLGRGNSSLKFPPAIFTAPPTLQPNGDYGGGIDDPAGAERVRGFKPVFNITDTGLHRPKIVICLGTKGGEYRQLVKGEDEIRQDAIMSQVFKFVNNLMLRRKSSSDMKTGPKPFPHKLAMATYNVVPLSPASGVLEWVENTTAFGDVIMGRGRSSDVGLHARYYPQEWNHHLCKRHFVDSPPSLKRETFDVVCSHFSPCFRFFFVEKFGHDMMAWHAARMRYIRSAAVSSMVGHILGIGDRHTSNILVHTKTGEVVQIDFGIVFEQGKLLNTPERVPFRLTRNMVDGMGPAGTEGTFVRSSEETIRILRKNASALLTILSAVVADPLYKWSVSPVEGMRRQKRETDGNHSNSALEIPTNDGEEFGLAELPEDKNEMGKKAIAKINDKLQGYEESTAGEQQGIEGQVQLLINSARDEGNLALMYAGWCPFV